MPDIESLLADATYLNVLGTDAVGRITKKMVLPDLLQSFISENLVLKCSKDDFIVKIVSEILGKELFIRFCESYGIPEFSNIIMFYHYILNNLDPNPAFDDYKMEPSTLYNFINEKITEIRLSVSANKQPNAIPTISSCSNIVKLAESKALVNINEKVTHSEMNLHSCNEIKIDIIDDKGCHERIPSSQSIPNLPNIIDSSSDAQTEIAFDCVAGAVLSAESIPKAKDVGSDHSCLTNDEALTQENTCDQACFSMENLSHIQSGNQNFLKDYTGFYLTDQLNDIAARIKVELIYSVKDKFFDSKYYLRYLQWKSYQYYYEINLNLFHTQRIIGRGGYGEVYGCLKVDTGFLYAIKIQDKKRIKKKHDERGILTERALLAKLNFPFIVSLVYAFQTSSKVIFIMDLLEGGDLRYNISNKKNFKEEEIMFYCRQIILTLKYLHSKNIIYRDLKPSNILLDSTGNTKLIDFGLATYCTDTKKASGPVGTYGYMAPEILREDYYDYSVDWFSLGCIMFKFVEGSSPFGGFKKSEDIIRATLEKQPELTKPFSEDLKSFVLRLLCKDPQERAGSKKHPIMEDPYLINVNWRDVYNKKFVPPISPDAKAINADDADEIGNFNDFELRKIKLSDADQSRYDGFYFFDEERWQQEVMDSQFESSNAKFMKDNDKLLNDFITFQKTLRSDGCIIYGLLMKKDHFIRLIWSKTIVALYESYIWVASSIYSNDKKLPLTDGISVEIISAPDFSFQISIKGKRFMLKASCEAEFNFWIDTCRSHPLINSNLSQHRKGVGRSIRSKLKLNS